MKYAVTVLCLIAVAALAGAPFNDTIGTSSVQLVPKRPFSATTWSSNATMTAGSVTKNGGYYYFIAAAGTSSNAPTHTTGEVTDNSVTYRVIESGKRNGVIVSVQTTSNDGGAVNLSLGSSAATNTCGLVLVGQGSSIVFGPEDNYQGAIHAVSSSGSNVVVGVQEF